MGARNLILTAVLLIALLAVASPQMLETSATAVDGMLNKPDTTMTTSQKAWEKAVKDTKTTAPTQVVIGGGEVATDGTRTPVFPAKDPQAAAAFATAGTTTTFDGGASMTNTQCATVTDQLMAKVFESTVDAATCAVG